MLDALIITLREGMEAALVLGIILTYLQRTGRTSLNRYVYWGLGLAILVSVALGVFLQSVGFDPENEVLEGTLMSIGGIFVASMVLWMWRTAKNIRQHMETQMESIVVKEKASRGAAIGLLVFTFFMVAREGVETVIFLTTATLGQASSILNLIGGTLGLALATLFAVLLIRGSLRINLSRFFAVTTIVLLLLAAKFLAGGIHEFAEVGAIPMTAGVMKILSIFVRDRTSSLILTGLIIVPILVILWDFRRTGATPLPSGESRAEQRKWRAARRWERVWQGSVLSATIIIVLALASQAFAASPFLDPLPQPVANVLDQELKLSTESWQPGELHKFSYLVGDIEVRFLAAKLADGGIVTALDVCQICGSKGYMQDKKDPIVICKVCNAPIPMTSMGQGGGCNPMRLLSRTEGNTLVVPVKGLQDQAPRFQLPEVK